MSSLSGYVSPTTQPESASLASHTTNINDQSLVENRITGLLSQDNNYMRQAETQGLQQANARGLLSSSMAVGEVENSRIAAALPIAQQDASLYGQADLQDSAYTQQGNLNTQNYQNNLNTAQFQGDINAGLQHQQGNISSRLQGEQGDINSRLQTEQGGINSRLQSEQGDINSRLQTEQGGINSRLQTEQGGINSQLQAETAIQNRQAQLQTSISNIESDTSLSPAQRDAMIQNEINMYNATATIIARSAGMADSTFLYSGMSSRTDGASTTGTGTATATESGGGTGGTASPTSGGVGTIVNNKDERFSVPGLTWIRLPSGKWLLTTPER